MEQRPVTSKSRGVCKYYNKPRGCFAGDKCKFLHGQPEDTKFTPYDQSKRCHFYARGYCKNGKACWFRHDAPDVTIVASDADEDTCCICFEKPVTYGLLSGCSHVFCLECIRQWRDPAGKQADVIVSGNTKKCPMCREGTKFITPSSVFYRTDDPRKEGAILSYKASMARISCKYFRESKITHGRPFCPFGKDCFYRHMNDDGTPHIFKEGVERCMQIHHARRRFTTSLDVVQLDMNEMFMLENALIEDQHIRFYDTTDDSDSDSGGPQISSIWRDMRAVFEAIGTALAPRQSETESHEESPPMQTGARTRARDWFWPPAQVANPTREQIPRANRSQDDIERPSNNSDSSLAASRLRNDEGDTDSWPDLETISNSSDGEDMQETMSTTRSFNWAALENVPATWPLAVGASGSGHHVRRQTRQDATELLPVPLMTEPPQGEVDDVDPGGNGADVMDVRVTGGENKDTPPEFTTDGRGRVIAVGPTVGQGGLDSVD